MDSPDQKPAPKKNQSKVQGLHTPSYAKGTSASSGKEKKEVKFKYVKPVGKSKIAEELNIKRPKGSKTKSKLAKINTNYKKPDGESRVSAEPRRKKSEENTLAFQTKNHQFRDFRPVEAKIKLPWDAKRDKMRSTVREVLDDMMQSIVVEVSLKLGVQLHAQQESIKEIVDTYLKQNSHVTNRTQRIKADCMTVVNAELHRIRGELKETLPAQILTEIEEITFGQLKIEIRKLESLVEKAKQANAANGQVTERQEEQLKAIQQIADGIPTDLEAAAMSTISQAKAFTETHIEQELAVLGDKQSAVQNKRLDQLTAALEELQGNTDKNLKNMESTGQAKSDEVDALLKKIDGKCCCTIM